MALLSEAARPSLLGRGPGRNGAYLRVRVVRAAPADTRTPHCRATARARPCVPLTRTSPSGQVAVITVDDQSIFRAAAREVVEATPGFEAAGEAASGEEAIRLVDEVQPHLALVDVRMPGMDGVETARRLSAAHPQLVIVLISLQDQTDLPSTAAESGAATFVRKQDFRPALLRSLWGAHGGYRHPDDDPGGSRRGQLPRT